MRTEEYRRRAAVDYGRKWALRRNPAYYNFAGLGGDCANFASQCVFAGAGVMNYTPTYGWYYRSVDDRAPAWSSVQYLHRFLTTNEDEGPFGAEVELEAVMPGDLIQLAISREEFHHTLVVVDTGEVPTLENTLICAHTYDSRDRPLATYDIRRMRCIHIEGVRK